MAKTSLYDTRVWFETDTVLWGEKVFISGYFDPDVFEVLEFWYAGYQGKVLVLDDIQWEDMMYHLAHMDLTRCAK